MLQFTVELSELKYVSMMLCSSTDFFILHHLNDMFLHVARDERFLFCKCSKLEYSFHVNKKKIKLTLAPIWFPH